MKNLTQYILEGKKKSSKVNIKKWSKGYEQEDLGSNTIIKWPESQKVLKKKGAEDNAWLIDDEDGFAKYGSAAFVVNNAWWEGKDEEESEEKDLDEKEEKSDNKDNSNEDNE